MTARAQGRPDDEVPGGVSVEELERERLRTYLDWAEGPTPAWMWPLYAAGVAGWLASYDLGPLWGTLGAIVFAGLAGKLAGRAMDRTGVTFPRWQGMPSRLRRTFLPVLITWLGAIAVGLTLLVAAQAPRWWVFGVATGVAMAAAGAVSGAWYRVEARRFARELGLEPVGKDRP